MTTIGSLFSGIGGLELGLEAALGARTVWQVEMDPYARRVLRKHWPRVDRTVRDVRQAGAATLAPVDLICGGFPCQDISVAGRGAGLAGARSGLWHEFHRVVREMGPGVVVVENVPALATRGLDVVLGALAELGYDAEWGVLSAAAVGAPHLRKRLFVIAWRDVADADRQGQLQQGGPLGALRGRTGNGGRQGPTVADGQRLKEQWGSIANGTEFIGPERDGWWTSESTMGRMANGVPGKLDGGVSCGGEKEHTEEACQTSDIKHRGMPGVRGNPKPATPSSQLCGPGVGGSPLPAVPCQGGLARWNSRSEEDEAVRSLRPGLPPYPQQEALALQCGVQVGGRPTECTEAMGRHWRSEPNISRVAHGVKNRVDRLHCLGNAVVPAVAFEIGLRVREILETPT